MISQTLPSASPPTRHPAHSPIVRGDIQALRAFAVVAVVFYHVWPGALPGGYIGVDVFFVISGFLITGQLVRRREEGTLRIGTFWAARARRLLPASLLVLACSVALTIGFAPAVLQNQYLKSVLASTFYFENWALAADAVDYLGQDNAPPIAQHYWSLSVEEQFYVLWPLIIIAGTWYFATKYPVRRTVFWILATLTVASFTLSLWLTVSSEAFAYFSTFGRIWEFGIGALVSVMAPWFKINRVVRSVLWIAAWLTLGLVLFFFTHETPFPAPYALLPTIAAAALIATGPQSPHPLLSAMQGSIPIRWLGDHSYGIYLWHWPLIIIAPAILGRDTDLAENLAIVVLTGGLAALTKLLVEDPLRFGKARWLTTPWRVATVSLAAMIVVAVLAAIPILAIAQANATREEESTAGLLEESSCVGASVFLEPSCTSARDEFVPSTDLIPSLTGLYEDTGGAFACYDQEPSGDISVCTFGSESATATRIALTGDSHAAMLVPGLREIAEARDWTIDTYVGRGCVWLDAPGPDDICAERRAAVDNALLTGGYDVILTTARNADDFGTTSRDEISQRHASAWQRAQAQGITVIALADNPLVPQTSFDCLTTSDAFASSTCEFPLDLPHIDSDPLRAAADASQAPLIDMTSAYCSQGSCAMVLGGAVIYRDLHHITGTFSKTLAPYLANEIERVLAATPGATN